MQLIVNKLSFLSTIDMDSMIIIINFVRYLSMSEKKNYFGKAPCKKDEIIEEISGIYVFLRISTVQCITQKINGCSTDPEPLKNSKYQANKNDFLYLKMKNIFM